MAPADIRVFVKLEVVVDVTLEIVDHTAEANHRLFRGFALPPGRQDLVGCRAGSERCAAADLAALGGEPAAAFGFASVVDGAAEDTQIAAEFGGELRALDGVGDGGCDLAHREADVGEEKGAEHQRIEGRVEEW